MGQNFTKRSYQVTRFKFIKNAEETDVNASRVPKQTLKLEEPYSKRQHAQTISAFYMPLAVSLTGSFPMS